MNVELLEEDANSTVKMVQVKLFGEKISVLSSNSGSRVTFSWIVMVCYELVADWGNPAFLIVKVILWFLQNKVTYWKQSYDGAMKMLPIVEEELP